MRDHEATIEDVFDYTDDFTSSGTAERYFQANRDRILNHLGGKQEHSAGSFDWYSEWENWARRQWERQQQGGGQGYQYKEDQQRQSYQQQRESRRQQTGRNFEWDFDANDPYVFNRRL